MTRARVFGYALIAMGVYDVATRGFQTLGICLACVGVACVCCPDGGPTQKVKR